MAGIGVIVLAAGRSTRFAARPTSQAAGRDQWRPTGHRLPWHSGRDAGVGGVTVVTGADGIRGAARCTGCRCASCTQPAYADGMAASTRRGVRESCGHMRCGDHRARRSARRSGRGVSAGGRTVAGDGRTDRHSALCGGGGSVASDVCSRRRSSTSCSRFAAMSVRAVVVARDPCTRRRGTARVAGTARHRHARRILPL